jgi:hypothetical protein
MFYREWTTMAPLEPTIGDRVQPVAFAALAVITVLSFVLFVLGRRFMHAYYAKHHAMPPMTWMFHNTGDPDLEPSRRLALGLLPIYLVALVLYLFRP